MNFVESGGSLAYTTTASAREIRVSQDLQN